MGGGAENVCSVSTLLRPHSRLRIFVSSPHSVGSPRVADLSAACCCCCCCGCHRTLYSNIKHNRKRGNKRALGIYYLISGVTTRSWTTMSRSFRIVKHLLLLSCTLCNIKIHCECITNIQVYLYHCLSEYSLVLRIVEPLVVHNSPLQLDYPCGKR